MRAYRLFYIAITMCLCLANYGYAHSGNVKSQDIWAYFRNANLTEANVADTYEKLVAFYNAGITSSFKGKDGINIVYRIFPGIKKEKTIVLLNGRSESALNHAEFIYNLSGLGYTIYTYDHRGQGFSGRMLKNSDANYVDNFQDYVDDLKIFYEGYVKPEHYKEVYLFAHSMGGGIATLFLEQNPAVFHKAVLLSPMQGINTEPYPAWLASALTKANMLIGREKAYVAGGHSYNNASPFENNKCTHSKLRFDFNKYVRQLYPEIRVGSASYKWFDEAVKATITMQKNAGDIKAKVLLIEAENDAYVLNSAHTIVCDKVKECTKITIKNAWHEIYNESDEIKNQAFAQILKFMEY